ncbi:ribonuclease Z [Haloplasma contractile]|uniref:Ribonuclease Z n=1 Tax=Haloplasma contractile SSD-17B TaxID=1033810 RepID=F7Q0L1_9MOLU|nr:ribonuclease Z [Haloplasma contractile]ERJ12644.1 Ribonuclease Z protein [Haloplasma contractile SSD-17B]
MLDLAFLGCGGSMPIPGRYLSSLLIRYEGRLILIDCGEGTQVSMKQVGWGLRAIDVILISHLHGDHIYGLPGLLATIRNSERTEPITIIGPKGIKRMMESILVLAPYLSYEIIILENPSEFTYLENMKIKTEKLNHTAPCLGYSFNIERNRKFDVVKAKENKVPKKIWSVLQNEEEALYDGVVYTPEQVLGKERKGLKLSYIADTRPTKTLPEFVKGSDLLITEGTYGDDEDVEKAIRNKHLTFKEAAEIAVHGEVSELLLTHFSPSILEPEEYIENARVVFKNSSVAHDHLYRSLRFSDDSDDE